MAALDALLGCAGFDRRLLVKDLRAFGVVGGACFVLDIAVFQLLYANAGVGAVTAKVVSTLLSMAVAYRAHRHWSSSHRAQIGMRRGVAAFAVING